MRLNRLRPQIHRYYNADLILDDVGLTWVKHIYVYIIWVSCNSLSLHITKTDSIIYNVRKYIF